MHSDDNFISYYAQEYPEREDVAESVVAWVAARCRRNRQIPNQIIIQVKETEATIPNRLKYFDRYLGCENI